MEKNALIAKVQKRFTVTLVIGGIAVSVADHSNLECHHCSLENMCESIKLTPVRTAENHMISSTGVDIILYICYISIMKSQINSTTNFYFYFWFSPSRKVVSLSFLK